MYLWWTDLPESRLSTQVCHLLGLVGHQASVVGRMFIHCQEPGDIWISRYLVPEQAGRGLLFYWMTRGGHISLPNSLHLIPLLAMGGRMQRMSKKKKLSEFREIDKERETEKSQAFQGHNAQDTGPCFLPFSYRICGCLPCQPSPPQHGLYVSLFWGHSG